jgi:hypothetical protein
MLLLSLARWKRGGYPTGPPPNRQPSHHLDLCIRVVRAGQPQAALMHAMQPRPAALIGDGGSCMTSSASLGTPDTFAG